MDFLDDESVAPAPRFVRKVNEEFLAMSPSDTSAVILYLLASLGLLTIVRRSVLTFVKDCQREWWEYQKWRDDNRYISSGKLSQGIGSISAGRGGSPARSPQASGLVQTAERLEPTRESCASSVTAVAAVHDRSTSPEFSWFQR